MREWISFKSTKQQIKETTTVLWSTTYDLIREISKNTGLTRNLIVKILSEIHDAKFKLYPQNPEDFILQVSKIINEQKASTLIHNVVYHKTNEKAYDTADTFTINVMKWDLQRNMMEVSKHIYDYVQTDSDIERKFAENLETWEVLVYAKLPRKFKINTPLGDYNPDRAIVFDKSDVKYIYFIAETKWSLSTLQLTPSEKLKIEYAKKHFAELANQNIHYDVVDSYNTLMNKVMK